MNAENEAFLQYAIGAALLALKEAFRQKDANSSLGRIPVVEQPLQAPSIDHNVADSHSLPPLSSTSDFTGKEARENNVKYFVRYLVKKPFVSLITPGIHAVTEGRPPSRVPLPSPRAPLARPPSSAASALVADRFTESPPPSPPLVFSRDPLQPSRAFLPSPLFPAASAVVAERSPSRDFLPLSSVSVPPSRATRPPPLIPAASVVATQGRPPPRERLLPSRYPTPSQSALLPPPRVAQPSALMPTASTSSYAPNAPADPLKRPRGRPKKLQSVTPLPPPPRVTQPSPLMPTAVNSSSAPTAPIGLAAPPKRPRGRPKKVKRGRAPRILSANPSVDPPAELLIADDPSLVAPPSPIDEPSSPTADSPQSNSKKRKRTSDASDVEE